jgi:hypothetical protein
VSRVALRILTLLCVLSTPPCFFLRLPLRFACVDDRVQLHASL